MDDLWKLREKGYRLDDLADWAEYNRLVKNFHEEEERNNLNNLLYRQVHINRESPKKTEKTSNPLLPSSKSALGVDFTHR
jgi:hypothetical protein